MSETIKRYKKSLKSIPIEMENDSGIVEKYTLVELTGPQRDEYTDTLNKRVKRSPDGNAVSVNSKGLETLLISMSLKDNDGNPVSVESMKEWPSSLINDLFEEASKMSGLNKDAAKEAKND